MSSRTEEDRGWEKKEKEDKARLAWRGEGRARIRDRKRDETALPGVGVRGVVNWKSDSWRAQADVLHCCESWQGDSSLDVFKGTTEKLSSGKQAVWLTFLPNPITEQNSRLFELSLFILSFFPPCSFTMCLLLLFITIILTYDLHFETLVCLTLVTFSLGNAVMSPDPRATFCQPLPLTSEFPEQAPPSSLAVGPRPLELRLPGQELQNDTEKCCLWHCSWVSLWKILGKKKKKSFL